MKNINFNISINVSNDLKEKCIDKILDNYKTCKVFQTFYTHKFTIPHQRVVSLKLVEDLFNNCVNPFNLENVYQFIENKTNTLNLSNGDLELKITL